jgi:hypothetical protein
MTRKRILAGWEGVVQHTPIWSHGFPFVTTKNKRQFVKTLNASKTELMLGNGTVFIRNFDKKEYLLNWFDATKTDAEWEAKSMRLTDFVRIVPAKVDDVTIYEQYIRVRPDIAKKYNMSDKNIKHKIKLE